MHEMNFRLIIAVAMLSLTLVGCNRVDNPCNWTQAQLETRLKETLTKTYNVELKEITLAKSDSGYTGTGKNAEGETYKIAVTNDAAGKKVSFKFDGDRGDHIEGEYLP
jgi:hypothetical protein